MTVMSYASILSNISESIKDVIGRKIKISVKKKVKLETKGDKVDNRILVSAVTVIKVNKHLREAILRNACSP